MGSAKIENNRLVATMNIDNLPQNQYIINRLKNGEFSFSGKI